MNDLGFLVKPRVNQLDANLLDSELLDQFKNKLMDTFKFWNTDIKDRFESELSLLLRGLLFKVTIWDHAATYGSKLQNLHIVDATTSKPIGRKLKTLYGCITILIPYFWSKILEFELISPSLQDKANLVWNMASLFNFVSFIFSGEYITLVMRLLGARFASVTRSATRNVNYEFQNRQLIWNALTEFLLFALPMFNFRGIIRKVLKPQISNSKGNSMRFLSRRMCAICFEQDSSVAQKGVTNPHTAGCNHAYCYVCLSLRLADDPNWRCLRCNETLSKEKLRPF